MPQPRLWLAHLTYPHNVFIASLHCCLWLIADAAATGNSNCSQAIDFDSMQNEIKLNIFKDAICGKLSVAAYLQQGSNRVARGEGRGGVNKLARNGIIADNYCFLFVFFFFVEFRKLPQNAIFFQLRENLIMKQKSVGCARLV